MGEMDAEERAVLALGWSYKTYKRLPPQHEDRQRADRVAAEIRDAEVVRDQVWGSGICSAHQTPDPTCPTCRPVDAAHGHAAQERDEARSLLAKAAREINCAGPVDHRIRILKAEFQTENTRLREALKEITNVPVGTGRDAIVNIARRALRDPPHKED